MSALILIPLAEFVSALFPLTLAKKDVSLKPLMIESLSRRFPPSKSLNELEVSTNTKSSETGLLVAIGLAFLTRPEDEAQPARTHTARPRAASLSGETGGVRVAARLWQLESL